MKKKIISIIIVILLILAGVCIFLYLKTDMFKSNQQLFWNYAIKNNEVADLFNNDSVKEIKNKNEKNNIWNFIICLVSYRKINFKRKFDNSKYADVMQGGTGVEPMWNIPTNFITKASEHLTI